MITVFRSLAHGVPRGSGAFSPFDTSCPHHSQIFYWKSLFVPLQYPAHIQYTSNHKRWQPEKQLSKMNGNSSPIADAIGQFLHILYFSVQMPLSLHAFYFIPAKLIHYQPINELPPRFVSFSWFRNVIAVPVFLHLPVAENLFLAIVFITAHSRFDFLARFMSYCFLYKRSPRSEPRASFNGWVDKYQNWDIRRISAMSNMGGADIRLPVWFYRRRPERSRSPW